MRGFLQRRYSAPLYRLQRGLSTAWAPLAIHDIIIALTDGRRDSWRNWGNIRNSRWFDEALHYITSNGAVMLWDDVTTAIASCFLMHQYRHAANNILARLFLENTGNWLMLIVWINGVFFALQFVHIAYSFKKSDTNPRFWPRYFLFSHYKVEHISVAWVAFKITPFKTCTARRPLWHDNRLSKRSISADETYLTISVECSLLISLVFDWRKSNHFDDFYIFVPSDLDLWHLDLKFAP